MLRNLSVKHKHGRGSFGTKQLTVLCEPMTCNKIVLEQRYAEERERKTGPVTTGWQEASKSRSTASSLATKPSKWEGLYYQTFVDYYHIHTPSFSCCLKDHETLQGGAN